MVLNRQNDREAEARKRDIALHAKLDELTKKIASETDQAKRQAMIEEANKIHADDIGVMHWPAAICRKSVAVREHNVDIRRPLGDSVIDNS